jgi:hypothetical protein
LFFNAREETVKILHERYDVSVSVGVAEKRGNDVSVVIHGRLPCFLVCVGRKEVRGLEAVSHMAYRQAPDGRLGGVFCGTRGGTQKVSLERFDIHGQALP